MFRKVLGAVSVVLALGAVGAEAKTVTMESTYIGCLAIEDTASASYFIKNRMSSSWNSLMEPRFEKTCFQILRGSTVDVVDRHKLGDDNFVCLKSNRHAQCLWIAITPDQVLTYR